MLLLSFVIGFAITEMNFQMQAAEARRPLPVQLMLQQSQNDLTERRKNAAQNEFTKNFSSLQQTVYALKQNHEEKKLTAQLLARGIKTIGKNARALRSVMVLGELPRPVEESKKPLTTTDEFDQAIQRLSSLVYEFAHNPIHKNRRVFNADQAARARTDLETIIILAKKIEDCAKAYRVR